MPKDNPFLDGLAQIFTDAAGAAQGARAEVEAFMKQRLERLIADMDFVPRDEFEAIKAIALKVRGENERLAARVAVLERRRVVKKRLIPLKPRAGRKL